MKLYVTPKGQWVGTQAEAPAACREEGSPPGSWKAVDVPTDKQNLLLFLNKGWKPAEPEPVAPRVRVRTPPSSGSELRWRVYGGIREKMFISAAHATTESEAIKQVADTLYARVPCDA